MSPRSILVLLPLFCGCAASRPIGDVVLGAGGAVLGNELSGGNPAITAAGAAGGVLLSEGAHFLAGRETRKAFASGYDQGRSDAVKQQYWLQVQLQRERAPASRVHLYPVLIPETHIDGVIIQPTVRNLRIQE